MKATGNKLVASYQAYQRGKRTADLSVSKVKDSPRSRRYWFRDEPLEEPEKIQFYSTERDAVAAFLKRLREVV